MDKERAQIEGLPSGQREERIIRFVEEGASALSENPPEQITQHLNDTRRRLRVFCACEEADLILMWSHYADQHRGVVLGFDAATLEHGFRVPLEPVDYQNDLPALFDAEKWIESLVFGLGEARDWGPERELGRKLMLTKSIHWKYEKEWRMVCVAAKGTLGDFQDFQFRREALVELVIGCRADQIRAEELRSLAYAFRPNVRFFQMSKHPSKFSLERREVRDTKSVNPRYP